MDIKYGKIILDNAKTVSGVDTGDQYIQYTDTESNTIRIPVGTVIRLYSILQYEIDRIGIDFDDYCKKVLSGKN